MVLMNATKRARMTDSYRINADNRCNGGMKKAGQAMYSGWMRSGHSIPDRMYFAKTTKNYIYINPIGGTMSRVVETCDKANDNTAYLVNRPVLPMRLNRKYFGAL